MRATPPAGTDGRLPRRARDVFALAFVACYAAMLLWAFATPLFAGPDEPVHVIKAVALWRGQLLGQLDTAPGAEEFAMVHVPGFYSVDRTLPKCFAHKPLVPASCAPAPPKVCRHLAGSTAPPCGVAFIYNARYPPLYYAAVGLPSLLGATDAALYLMRALSGLYCAVFLALAFTAAWCWSRRRSLLAGLVVAATPMVVYLGGVVNPSGLEIAAALCAWTTAVIVVLERPANAPRPAVVLLAVSASVFISTRSLSPFWLALGALTVAALASRGDLAALVRRRDVQVAALVVAVVGIVAVVWILKEHATAVLSTSTIPQGTPTLNILEESFRHNVYYVPTMIGVFGEFDTFSPTLAYVVWYSLLGLLVLGAIVVSGGRRAVALGAMVVAIVLVPVAISSSQAHRYGYTWNGRDTLPFAVGLPILAAFLLGGRERDTDGAPRVGWFSPGRLVALVAALAGIAQFAAFEEALRRYAVGVAGPAFGFLAHSPWDAPGGNATLVVLEGAVLLGCGWLVTRAARTRPAFDGTHPEPGAPGSVAAGGQPSAAEGADAEVSTRP